MNRVIIQVIILFLIICSNLFALSIEPKEAMKYIGDKNVRFISSDNTKEYIKEHIIGAVSIYIHNIKLRDKKDIEEYLSLKGITNTQLLIIYSNISISNTYLLEDFFKNIGHKRVVVLNDGCHGIKLLDPNQKIYNELKAKRKKYEILSTLTKDKDEFKSNIYKSYLNLPHEIWARCTQAIDKTNFTKLEMNDELTDIWYEMRPINTVAKEFKHNFHGFVVLPPKMKEKMYRKVSQFWHIEQEKLPARTKELRREEGLE